ncbi:hypothetical protein R3W88_033636 [Solanum pinnatisectum]|uniref:Gag-pol polyprotein n=1 Tax=Solanum pinnatisectum TaxID=50273 RepID=A0AAV9K292_9SOLN|nr:hypothetical protein R3W88_033636 [Solanum pinnatisectum]
MSRFVTGVSDSIKEECRAAMLHDNMDISCLMVYAQQVEETRIRKKNREVKRARTDDGNLSNGKFEGQGRPRFKKSFSNQGSSSSPRSGHQLKDCPTCTTKGRDDKQTPPSGSNSNAPKKNCFYALQSRGDQESSSDVVTGILQVFSIDVYALLDPGATL